MSFRINPPTKIYVDKSPIHGWGVFASQDIETGEIIEEVPVLELPINKGEVTSLLIDYRFNWPQGVEWDKQVVGLGFASLYNHSNDANAYWVSDLEKNTFKKAVSDKRCLVPSDGFYEWKKKQSFFFHSQISIKNEIRVPERGERSDQSRGVLPTMDHPPKNEKQNENENE